MSEREKYIIVIEGQLIEVTQEVYEIYYKSRRKERYFMQELKAGRSRINKETGEEYFLPSLEDYYDGLLGVDKQFADRAGNVVEEVIQKLLLDKLHIALEELSDEEAEIIWQLYYEEIGETELARRLGIPRSTLQYRKRKILDELKDRMPRYGMGLRQNQKELSLMILRALQNMNRVGSVATYKSFESTVRLHIVPKLGKKKMVNIGRGDVQKLYNDRANYSHAVACSVKMVMNLAFRYAIEKKVISENPTTGVNLPKKVKKKAYHTRNIDAQKTLTMEQIQRLLEASKETPIYMQVLLNVLMGLRKSEIIGVKYSDINYINRNLTVQRQLGYKKGVKKEDVPPKTFSKQEIHLKTRSSYRELPIPDYVFEAILEQRKIYEKNKSRRRAEFMDEGYVCCSTYGKPRSKDFHWKYYKQLLEENNLPNIKWHDLRSTFCTLLLKNNFNPKAVSKLMGHAKELITMDVYGDNRELIADCVDEIQPFIDIEMLRKLSYKSELGINLKKNLHYFDKEKLFEELVKVNSWYDEFGELHELALDYRIKSTQSGMMKYERYYPDHQARKVFDDLLGFRSLCDNYEDVMALQGVPELRIADMSKGKANDDGYRGVHVYFQLDGSHYPIEIQYNTYYDRQFNNWLHKYVYKKNFDNSVGCHLRELYESAKIQSEQDFKEALEHVLSGC